MGGHGIFVWGSFGVSLALMVAEPLWTLARKRAALQEPLADEFDEAHPLDEASHQGPPEASLQTLHHSPHQPAAPSAQAQPNRPSPGGLP
jgi:heme exporter protein CcmD